jgi:unsaturated rhamnogalacturonyl hydrolase
MDSANLDRALRIKSNAVRGGVIENIFMRRVTINQVKEAVLTIDLLYEEGAKGNFPPTIRNIAIERTEASASPRVMFIRGFEGAVIDGIRFSDCTFKGVSAPEVLSGAGSVLLRNVNIVPASKPKSANSVGDAN